MQNFTDRINTNIYISAALELGLRFNLVDKAKGIVELTDGTKTLKVRLAVLDCVDENAKILSKDKIKSLKLIEDVIPTTLGKLFQIDDSELISNINELLKSSKIVLKMNNGKGGVHVYVGLSDIAQVNQAVESMKKDNIEEVIVEKYFEGKNYRVIVCKGKLLDIIERNVPNVVGDGVNNLKELIEIKNKTKSEIGDVYLISQDLIESSGFTSEFVPDKNEIVELSKISSLSMGGDVHRMPHSFFDSEITEKLIQVQKLSGLFYCGIDVIYDGINYVVNEYNYAPGMSLHYLADNSKSLDVPKNILSEIFKYKL